MGRYISIHALLAESDQSRDVSHQTERKFLSTLSLRRATITGNIVLSHILLFLSTLSLRRATHADRQQRGQQQHFYPRSPCGERPLSGGTSRRSAQFLSTLSLRRATINNCITVCNRHNFYPRSPCGERHLAYVDCQQSNAHFYPRSPCGERLSCFLVYS